MHTATVATAASVPPPRQALRHRAKPAGAAAAELGLLQALMNQPDSADLAGSMAEIASQLGRHSGWRWVGIARMGEEGVSAQLLAFTDHGRPLAGYTYELAMAPCQLVSEAEGVVHIDRVAERFAHEAQIRDMGAVHYAGLAYRRGDRVLGHVLLIHDHDLTSAQAHQADALLQLAALQVGNQLEVAGMRLAMQAWQHKAETDALTQMPNRHAFERELTLQQSLVSHGARADSLLAIFDVNGLKLVNDSLGHLAGDELLRKVGEALRSQLRRSQDQVFRIGGDEFALITDAPKGGCEAWLAARTREVATSLSQVAGFEHAGLSIGMARLHEAAGKRAAWLAMADARMYADKGKRRRA